MKKGDVFNYYNKGKKKYTALQIVETFPEKNQCILLALYYWNDEPLKATDLNTIKPFWRNHHNWKGEYDFMLCEDNMPNYYTFVGNREVLAYPDEELSKVTSWSYPCLQISLQTAWDELPESFRTKYKSQKANDKLFADHIAEMNSGIDIDNYPVVVTEIEVEGEKDWLIDYINTHHNITKLIWENNPEGTIINLSETRIIEFKTDGKGIKKIILNDYLNELAFFGDVPDNIEIVAQPMNRSFRLETRNTNNLKAFKGLNISSLHMQGKATFDMKEVATYLPQIKELRIWGSPSYITNMHEIAALKSLSWLTINEIFGFTADNFPAPVELPAIKSIWLHSIPEDVAKKVKKEYKNYDLWIQKGRKPEWLEANLNNPFRDWDGDDYILPAHAKKSAALYAKLYAQADKLLKQNPDTGTMLKELEEMVKVFTLEFNKMDKRKPWIDTVIRENIYDALLLLLKPFKDKVNTIYLTDEVFDSLRDF